MEAMELLRRLVEEEIEREDVELILAGECATVGILGGAGMAGGGKGGWGGGSVA